MSGVDTLDSRSHCINTEEDLSNMCIQRILDLYIPNKKYHIENKSHCFQMIQEDIPLYIYQDIEWEMFDRILCMQYLSVHCIQCKKNHMMSNCSHL